MNQSGPIVLIVGTRPEGIKMMPVYFALKRAGYPVLLCSTMQHDELLTEVLDLFGVQPDVDLGVMRLGQDLFYLTQSILQKTKEVFMSADPSLVLVQGDTTSTYAAALSAFYLGIPIGHVEAGLRTDDIRAPFPEEMNRRSVGVLADFHFAPTQHAVDNLLAAGINKSNIFLTGNTVVDALHIIKEKILTKAIKVMPEIRKRVNQCKKNDKRIMLLTVHRRESFGGGIEKILTCVKEFLQKNNDVICFYPYHPNPHVVHAIEAVGLCDLENMYLSEPVAYKDLVHILLNVDWVLTDSGGIQEEAVSLSKPVLVLREKTERIEGVEAGLAQLVGADPQKIRAGLQELATKKVATTNKHETLYGDGYAAEKITAIIQSKFPDVHEYSDAIGLGSFTKRDPMKKKVCVVGLGYMGLPTSIVLADHGFNVVGFDVDEERVEGINNGNPMIHEPEVYEKLQVALGSGRFRATTTIEPADYFILAVPTPFKEGKKADLSYVFAATESILPVLQEGNTVILESTVPVGTTDTLAKTLEEKTELKEGETVFVAHCPERVLPGKIFYELVENDRIIGGASRASAEKAGLLYERFVRGTICLTNAKAAEMVKLVENSSRDAQIAFANEVASMAYASGLNPYEVIALANKHPRVNILNPSCGVGGHCLAVDPYFLIETFPEQSKLIQAARAVNDDKPQEVLRFIKQATAQKKKKCTVLVLGLTYKADVDDLRESPALGIAQELATWKDIELLVCEPHINKKKLHKLFKDKAVSLPEGLGQADVVVYLVPHTRFKAIDKKMLLGKTILDFTGMVYRQQQKEHGDKKLFWPAHSVMDFFIVQHNQHDYEEKQ